MDLFVLALQAAGVQLPADRAIDGRDPLPALRDGAPSPHRNLYFRYRDTAGMRQGRWKVVRPGKDRPLELYDLSVDFAEARDLAVDRSELAGNLWREYEAWLASLQAGP